MRRREAVAKESQELLRQATKAATTKAYDSCLRAYEVGGVSL